MNRAAVGLALLGALAVGQRRAQAADSRPDWCRPGYVCITTRDAAEATIRLADLEAQLEAARVRRKSSWGFAVGPALSVVYEPARAADGAVDWDWHAGLGGAVIWGFRF